ncbi:MAG: hypothetical protein IH623_02760 [Verrucomicrobia bacterium]|nr:hypothetical protein [Verrucomicrobiota bacterium]
MNPPLCVSLGRIFDGSFRPERFFSALVALLLLNAGAAPAAVYSVNSVLDYPDGNGGDGLCDTGTPESGTTGICTLRAALEVAQMGDTIVFGSSLFSVE